MTRLSDEDMTQLVVDCLAGYRRLRSRDQGDFLECKDCRYPQKKQGGLYKLSYDTRAREGNFCNWKRSVKHMASHLGTKHEVAGMVDLANNCSDLQQAHHEMLKEKWNEEEH